MYEGRGRGVKRNILLIEDCPEDQQCLSDTLQAHGYTVSTISDPLRAMSKVEDWARQYHLVIIEEAMAGRSGLTLLREARVKRHDLPVVVVTREGDWNGYARALSEGAIGYIPYPIDRRELLATVEQALNAVAA